MNSLRAERDVWQRAIQGTSANEVQLPQVFPEYIYVNLEGFMRAADPFWEPDRPTSSSLYKARAKYWDAFGAGAGAGARASRDYQTQGTHPVQLQRRHSHLQGVPSQLDTAPKLEEVDPLLEEHPKLEAVHPQFEFNPQLEEVTPRFEAHTQLQEVPLHFEDYYFQPKIPQRRSSLYFSSRPASHAQQSHHPPGQFDDLFQGLAQVQVDEHQTTESEDSQELAETTENGSVASQSKCEANMRIVTCPASKRHTIHFGSNLGEMKLQLPVHSPAKEGRAQSVALAVDEEPEKPLRSLFGSIRKRRSALGTPVGDFNSGRKSSASIMLRDMRRSSKEFFSKLAVRKKEEYDLRIAFIGNQHCGKDALLSRYTLTANIGNIIYRPDVDPFRVKLTGVLSIDNYKARTEIWDIAHRNVKKGQVHPLTMASFDVVVICVDIGDECNLKSVAKWQRVAQRYCPGVPSIVLGLNTDLRPDFPTLRLGFLKESTAFTVGQGEEAARQNKASAYYECSAKTGEGVTEFFESLVRFSVQATRPQKKLQQKASRRLSSLFRKK